MAVQLHQIIALEKGAAAKAASEAAAMAATLGKTNLLSGLARTYQPLDDGGTVLPPESQRVQVRASTSLRNLQLALTRLFDLTLTKDHSNTIAKAPVVVDGQTVATDLPVPYLLWLERRLAELMTQVRALPTLDPGETWRYDEATDTFATEPVKTMRTRKVMRNHVLAAATDKHPAQVQVYTEDVAEGTWTQVKYSGALTQARVTQLRDRLAKLIDAVRVAREQANSTAVVDRQIGEALFGYLLAD